jgi:enoyl-[acyl-carrier protein] reductase II
MESGGHIGEETTMTIVSEIVKSVSIPVIAAGGIVNGTTFNAAIALGASGVQMGTRFVASIEAPVAKEYKDVIVSARDIDTVVTGRKFQAPVRIYKNELARNYLELENSASDRLELEKLAVGSHKKAVSGDIKNGSIMMGQNAGLIEDIKSVSDIMKDIIEEAIKDSENFNIKINELKSI